MNFDWVTISQISGTAGEHSLAVTVTKTHTGRMDRVKSFIVVSPDGKRKTTLTITQKGSSKEFNHEFNSLQFS